MSWTRSLTDYLADAGWTLKYALVGPTALYEATATANGADFAITIPAAASAAYVPGSYRVAEYVEKAGERHTLGAFAVEVLPDLTTASAGIRTHARRMLDAIEAWLENKAPTAATVEINGRKLQNYPLTELLAMRNQYRIEVARETGVNSGRVLVRL